MNDSTLPNPAQEPASKLLGTSVRGADSALYGSAMQFEVNTDSALIDQRWLDFEDQHERRYGLAIDHLKSLVRGRSYDNDAMKLRVGAGGFYTQAQHFPAAFFGDTAKAYVSFVSETEAAALVWEAVAHYRSEEASALTAVYSDDEPPEFFFGYRVSQYRRYEIGFLRTTVPLHLRVLFDNEVEVPLLGSNSGVLIYQRTRNGKHVVVKAPGRRQPLMGFAPLD